MTSVDQLLEQYAAGYRSGDTDPWPYLDQVEGEDRAELERLMELFLLNAEAPEWDPATFQKSPAAIFANELVPRLLVPENGWSDLLPSLRMRMQIKREKVDAELAAALEARDDREAGKVADYYHDMEQGNIDPAGVSDQVLEALSGIYGTTVKVLRNIGRATRPRDSPGAVFARSEQGVTGLDEADRSRSQVVFSRIKGKPDRIDRLFVDVDRSDPGR